MLAQIDLIIVLHIVGIITCLVIMAIQIASIWGDKDYFQILRDTIF